MVLGWRSCSRYRRSYRNFGFPTPVLVNVNRTAGAGHQRAAGTSPRCRLADIPDWRIYALPPELFEPLP